MKQIITYLLLLTVFMFSCGDKKKEQKIAEEKKAAIIKEVKTLDSATHVIENVKADIDKTSEELDNLLNELD